MAKITAGVHGDFTRYRPTRDDKQLWCDALAALGGETWRDRRRQYRALREQLDRHAAGRALWDASPRRGRVREQLTAVIVAGDSFNNALAACDGPAIALLSRQASPWPPEGPVMQFAETRAAVARALASLPEDKGGPSPDLPLHQLLRSLAEVWEAEGKGAPPRPTWIEGEDVESGQDVAYYQDNPFMALCEAVARLAGVEFKNKRGEKLKHALAGQILRVVFEKT